MTFDEKKTQVEMIKDIGRLLDREGTPEVLERLRERVQASEGGRELLDKTTADQRTLREAVPADLPEDTLLRLEGVINREFERRMPVGKPPIGWTQAAVLLAASLLLVAGTFAATSFWMQDRMDQAVASLAAHMETERTLLAQTVQEALETRVSGEPVYIGQDGDWAEILTPIQTYKSKSGHWCRQYLRESRFGKIDLTIRGTACRDETGTWTTVFAEPVTDDFAPQTPGI